ncbi:MAG TPA: DUF397 domain-containing protein [Pseudonocardiaceae bacterium]|nr:DUF397 domain-containing protein [Pseudonocardiaceae bacterium]
MTQPFLVGVTWRTSSRSATQGECVEIAHTPTAIGIRDSKNPTGAYLSCTPTQWTRFLTGVKSGELDLLS